MTDLDEASEREKSMYEINKHAESAEDFEQVEDSTVCCWNCEGTGTVVNMLEAELVRCPICDGSGINPSN